MSGIQSITRNAKKQENKKKPQREKQSVDGHWPSTDTDVRISRKESKTGFMTLFYLFKKLRSNTADIQKGPKSNL